jgi:hypothetical protein
MITLGGAAILGGLFTVIQVSRTAIFGRKLR